MAKKIATLEEFIKNYVQNVKIGNTTESYADWLKEHGVDAKRAYSSGIGALDASYLKTTPKYGKAAEKISDMGLSESGYAEYLEGKAKKEYADNRNAAESEYLKLRDNNMKAYTEYTKKSLSNEEKLRNETIKSAVNFIKGANNPNFGDAYDYAISQGLSEDDAKAVASKATEYVRYRARKIVAQDIILRRLTRTQTRNYCLTLGLSPEDAEELAEYAYRINESTNTADPDSILGELKDKLGL